MCGPAPRPFFKGGICVLLQVICKIINVILKMTTTELEKIFMLAGEYQIITSHEKASNLISMGTHGVMSSEIPKASLGTLFVQYDSSLPRREDTSLVRDLSRLKDRSYEITTEGNQATIIYTKYGGKTFSKFHKKYLGLILIRLDLRLSTVVYDEYLVIADDLLTVRKEDDLIRQLTNQLTNQAVLLTDQDKICKLSMRPALLLEAVFDRLDRRQQFDYHTNWKHTLKPIYSYSRIYFCYYAMVILTKIIGS